MDNPCNGNPERIVYGRTPFDTYTAYLYVVNNGQRANPAAGADTGMVVYDSIQFRVVPPEPVLHEVKPDYVLSERNDTLSLAVSKLWLDTGAAALPSLRLSYPDTNGLQEESLHSNYKREIRSMQTTR